MLAPKLLSLLLAAGSQLAPKPVCRCPSLPCRSNAQTRALSHPLPVLRAREVDRWANSQQYQALVAANLPRDNGSGIASSGGVQRAAAQ